MYPRASKNRLSLGSRDQNKETLITIRELGAGIPSHTKGSGGGGVSETVYAPEGYSPAENEDG